MEDDRVLQEARGCIVYSSTMKNMMSLRMRVDLVVDRQRPMRGDKINSRLPDSRSRRTRNYLLVTSIKRVLKDTRHGQPIHDHYTMALTNYSRLSSAGRSRERKERNILNHSDPELLCGSQSCQYRKKEKTKDRPRRGCITAAIASLSRGVSSSQPLDLSLLYKRNKL